MKSTAQTIIHPASTSDIVARVEAIDWTLSGRDLDAQGCAVLRGLLSADECRAHAALYPDDRRFRSRVVMGRHGFGRGEYKYFSYPLPDLIGELRLELYARLRDVANRWNEAMGIDIRIPPRTTLSSSAAMMPGKPGRRRCCCNMVRATIIACTRISMASTCFRYRLRSCCPNRSAILLAASSC
jgi:hypothetical protein